MKVGEYKKSITGNLRQSTLCFLVKDNEILLAMKKRGFGTGKWNGVGGKPQDNETIEETAKRETQEEIGVLPISLRQMTTLNFYFQGKPEWDQEVVVFLSDKWDGIPTESEEMEPKWFKVNEIPYDQMWEDDKFWLPKVLKGIKVQGDFLFDENQKPVDHYIKEVI